MCALPSYVQSGNAVCAAQMVTAINEIDDVTWWVDFGSLLALERGGGLMLWDDDFDISTTGLDARALAARLRDVVARNGPKAFAGECYQCLPACLYGPHSNADVCRPSVHNSVQPGGGVHVQLWCQHTHVDAFVWTKGANGTFVIDDGTTRQPVRRRGDVVPVSSAPNGFGGALRGAGMLGSLHVPRRSKRLLEAEYGAAWATPRVTHRECLNVRQRDAWLPWFYYQTTAGLVYIGLIYSACTDVSDAGKQALHFK